MEKVYHIYAKEECLYNNLNEEQFKNTWNTLKGMVGLLHTDYASEDLSYEAVTRHFQCLRRKKTVPMLGKAEAAHRAKQTQSEPKLGVATPSFGK